MKEKDIDLDYVQKLIEKEISPDFEIYKYFNTEPYVIFFWKHKNYHIDDERGHIIGPGPVVFDKKKKEYRILGSAEWFSEDVAKVFETEEVKEERRDYEYLMSLLEGGEDNSIDTDKLIEKIKANILRRKYINSEDIDFLCILTGARRIGIPFNMTSKSNWKDNDHIVVIFENKISHEKLIKFWKKIDFKYEILSKTELLLWKIKPSPNSGFTKW